MRVAKWRNLAFLTVLICAQALPGQSSQDETLTLKARTDIVLVPVVVRDSSGASVRGLQKGDFTVLESGKPQEIAVAEEIRTASSAKPATPPQNIFSNQFNDAAHPQRLSIIALDMVSTSFSDQAYARYQLIKFLSQTVDSHQPTALVTITRNGLHMVHDFTTDTSTLTASLKGVTGGLAPGMAVSNSGKVDRGVRSDVIKQALTASNMQADAADPSVRIVADEVERLLAFQSGQDNEFNAIQRPSLETSLESLQHLAQAYAGVPGKKSLIWVTGGFPFDISKSGEITSPTVFAEGTTTRTAEEIRSGYLGHLPEATNTVQNQELKALKPLYCQTMQMLASANLAVYPVDASALVAYFPGAESKKINLTVAREDQTRRGQVASTLESFAAMTGGTACYSKNDLQGCFATATRDTESYYLLGYYRNQKNNKEGWRPLEVKVVRPGVQVRARSGYFYSSQGSSAANARKMDVALALASPVEYTALPILVKLEKSSGSAKKGKQPYDFIVHIPGREILFDEKNGNAVNMDFVAAANGPKGERADSVSQQVSMQLKSDDLTKLRSDGLNYNNSLLLPSGQYTVRFVVRDNLTGRVGSIVAPLAVE